MGDIVENIAGGESTVIPSDLASVFKKSGAQITDIDLSIPDFSAGLVNGAQEASTVFNSIGSPEDILAAAVPSAIDLDVGDLGADKIKGVVDAASTPVRKIDALLSKASGQIPNLSAKIEGLPSVGAISALLPKISGLSGAFAGISIPGIPTIPGLPSLPNIPNVADLPGGDLAGQLQDAAGTAMGAVEGVAAASTGGLTGAASGITSATSRLDMTVSTDLPPTPDELQASIIREIGVVG